MKYYIFYDKNNIDDDKIILYPNNFYSVYNKYNIHNADELYSNNFVILEVGITQLSENINNKFNHLVKLHNNMYNYNYIITNILDISDFTNMYILISDIIDYLNLYYYKYNKTSIETYSEYYFGETYDLINNKLFNIKEYNNIKNILHKLEKSNLIILLKKCPYLINYIIEVNKYNRYIHNDIMNDYSINLSVKYTIIFLYLISLDGNNLKYLLNYTLESYFFQFAIYFGCNDEIIYNHINNFQKYNTKTFYLQPGEIDLPTNYINYLHMKLIELNYKYIIYIENPSYDIQLYTYNKNKNSLIYINNIDYLLQEKIINDDYNLYNLISKPDIKITKKYNDKKNNKFVRFLSFFNLFKKK